jgi:threonine efflux protein
MTSLPHALLALSVIHLLAAMIPGPNMVVTAHIAASRSGRAGLACVGGVVVATLAWVSLTLAGVGIVLQELGVFYSVLKAIGAAYLFWLGVRMIWSAARKPVAVPVAGQVRRSAFRSGLLTCLSNPKSAVFWTSVFVVAVPAGAPVWFYLAVIALIGVQTSAWYGFVALAFAAPRAQAAYRRFGRYVEGLAGAAMIGFGLKLAVDAEAGAH